MYFYIYVSGAGEIEKVCCDYNEALKWQEDENCVKILKIHRTANNIAAYTLDTDFDDYFEAVYSYEKETIFTR